MSDMAPAEGQRLAPIGLLVSFVTGLPQLFVPLAAVLFGTRDSNVGLPLIILAVLLGSLFLRWLVWLRFTYTIGADDVRIESGLLSRAARSIPYDRIADVSVEQKPLARLLDLAEVKFETGGGKGDEGKLSFVTLAEAERLRAVVRERRGEAGAVQTAEAPIETARLVFAMNNRRLLTLGFYSFSLVIFAVLAGAAQQFDFLLPFKPWDWEAWSGIAADSGVDIVHLGRGAQLGGALAALIALLGIGLATGVIRTFLTDYGFTLERTARGFRRQRGLLTRTDVTMPLERIQAVAITTGAVRVRRGWHALHFVSLANDGKSKGESDHLVAPLATLDEIWPIVSEVGIGPPDGALGWHKAASRLWFDRTLLVLVPVLAALAVVSARTGPLVWLALIPVLLLAVPRWFAWRHQASASDPVQLYSRRGWWSRRLDLARKVNVQSVSILQGPLMRRRELARVEFGIAGGHLRLEAIPLALANELRERVLAIAAPVDFSQLGLSAR